MKPLFFGHYSLENLSPHKLSFQLCLNFSKACSEQKDIFDDVFILILTPNSKKEVFKVTWKISKNEGSSIVFKKVQKNPRIP